jgi:uncharacterized protein YgbK (DUF1537 family)
MQILIVADDLTGALDSAAAMAGVGLRCRVARRPSDLSEVLDAGVDVLAVSTASREGPAEQARNAVGRVFEVLGDRPVTVFKKIDSRLKGHVGAELDVIRARTGIGRAVAAPAIPAQGRATERGQLVGAGVATPVDVAAALAGSGLAVEVPDAESDADLDGVVAAALSGPPTLLVGAAGLAAALGRHVRPGQRAAPPARLSAPVLFAIGSRDPITLAQVEALRAAGVDEIEAPGGELSRPPRTPMPETLLVRLVAGSGAFDPERAGARFGRSVGELLASRSPGTLFACGGETADAILGGLGVGVLEVEGELLPGVPVSTIVVSGRDLRLVTKSGGFGGPDVLLTVLGAAGGGREERGR